MSRRFRSIVPPLIILAAALGCEASTSLAAPFDATSSVDNLPDLRPIVDEMEAEARKLPYAGESRWWNFMIIARHRLALGDRAGADRLIDEVEQSLTLLDADDGVSRRSHLARTMAQSDPVRSRRLLAEARRLIREHLAPEREAALSETYFAIGEHAAGLQAALLYPETTRMHSYLVAVRRAAHEGRRADLEDFRRLIRAATLPAEKEKGEGDEFASGRIHALAAADLPEEAEAALRSRWKDRLSAYGESAVRSIAASYVRNGDAPRGLRLLHEFEFQLDDHQLKDFAEVAAYAGDFDYARSLVLSTTGYDRAFGLLYIVLIAHKLGHDQECADCLELFRETLAALPADAYYGVVRSAEVRLATVEAQTGRFESSLRLLPRCRGEEGILLRNFLVNSVLAEQNEGRLPTDQSLYRFPY